MNQESETLSVLELKLQQIITNIDNGGRIQVITDEDLDDFKNINYIRLYDYKNNNGDCILEIKRLDDDRYSFVIHYIRGIQGYVVSNISELNNIHELFDNFNWIDYHGKDVTDCLVEYFNTNTISSIKIDTKSKLSNQTSNQSLTFDWKSKPKTIWE